MADLKGYGQLHARMKALEGAALPKLLGLAAVREQKLIVRRKTGNLGRSIGLGPVGKNYVITEAKANYAAFVELGTRPHEITPNARKALRFAASASGRRLTGSPRTGAAVVFAKRVHHPGTKPYPFMVPGAKKAVAAMGADAIVKIWNGAA